MPKLGAPRLNRYTLDVEENYLRSTRLQYGRTQSKLAELADTTQNIVSYLELGYTPPITKQGQVKDHVHRICEVLGVKVEDLFPRDICSIRKNTVVVEEQLFGTVMVDYAPITEEMKDDLDMLLQLMQYLKPHTRELILAYHSGLYSMGELCSTWNRSPTAILRVIQAGIRVLRGWYYTWVANPRSPISFIMLHKDRHNRPAPSSDTVWIKGQPKLKSWNQIYAEKKAAGT